MSGLPDHGHRLPPQTSGSTGAHFAGGGPGGRGLSSGGVPEADPVVGARSPGLPRRLSN
jgi:hypothetical protein